MVMLIQFISDFSTPKRLDNSISLRLVLGVNWSPGRDLAGKEETRTISELLPG